MSAPSSSSSAGKPDRLFVGNLASTVDEYTLVQVFGKHGKIAKLDLMYHKTGPLKGKPRGYAFVEFASKDDALKALVKLHDRLLRGRKLVVTYANAAPIDESMAFPKSRRIGGDASKPTTLSLLKSQRRPQSAAAQIAAMEAKLASMQKRSNRTPTPEREAAEALEDEINRELGELSQGGDQSTSTPTLPESEPPTTAPSKSALPAPVEAKMEPMPPKPVASAASHRPQEARSLARQEAFQRGLASLPAKPAFSSHH